MTIENGIAVDHATRTPRLHDLRFSPDALWQLGEDAGALDLSDSSGNDETLEVSVGAVAPAVGLAGKCCAPLDSTDRLSLVTDNGNLGYVGAFTFMGWVYIVGSGTGCIICYDATGTVEASSAPWSIFYNTLGNSGAIVVNYEFWNGSSITTRSLSAQVGLRAGEWIHLVVYRYVDGGNTKTNGYVNGKKLWATDQTAGGIPTKGSNAGLLIGGLAGGSTPMSGYLQSLLLKGSQISTANLEAEIARVCPNNLLGDN